MATQCRSQAPLAGLAAQVCPTDPTCYSQAVKHSEWREAMDQEFNALLQNQTWCLVPSTPSMNVIGCKWVFRTKRKADGSIERQLDVHNAFLNGSLSETVYMCQPPGYADSQYPDHVCLLRRSFFMFILVYVDDIFVMGSSQGLVDSLLAKLSTTFKIRDLGKPGFFLGVETMQCGADLLLSQQRYMNDILKRAGMSDCKPLSTPISLTRASTLQADPYDDPTRYKSPSWALQYLTVTRPDLSFTVNLLCQHMHAPRVQQWEQLKRVLRYVKGTLLFGLCVRSSSSRELHAFSDSDWAGCPKDRKSTSGFVVFLGSNLVSWVCKKQRTVAMSSTESEYKALADVCVEVTWILSLLRELRITGVSVPKLWCENLGATYMCANPIFHARTKHVEIDYHFVRDKVADGEI
ncbi:uncharacterized protein LOC116001083 [Ipomoea triloba]|uniref:uncharacterized protein LOC116001083 n=1 Tax=Ipomoea triloba TaxID=35885 RepID=UPI00125D9010|nr:uncharacterized protein LOC116001083 [Ipomoea triloba]